MKAERPVNLNLTKIRFPITALSSLFHRISGVVIFLFVPWALYMLHVSVYSSDSFTHLQPLLADPLIRFFNWVFVCAVSYHLLAGIRHIMMDFGFWETVKTATVSAYLVMIGSVILFILAGIWLW